MPILKDEQKRTEIIDMLTRAYWMEVETVANYLAGSINPDGVRAEEIRQSLGQEITDELGHAQQFGHRIKELYGEVPGSLKFKPNQGFLQPASDQTDVLHVINGVIKAEQSAVDFYTQIIKSCEGVDYATQDMVIQILKDEQKHLRLFEGFAREYEKR